MDNSFQTIRVGKNDLAYVHEILVADAVEHGQDGAAAVRGFDASLAQDDFLSSNCFWLLIALDHGRAAGYLSAVRIPKGDARKAFIYVDELWVLQAYRRRGIATALLDEIGRVGLEVGARGIRLITRVDNSAGRALYQRAGFDLQESIFCQKLF